jgi:predicted lactoylglutathione lyase
MKKDLWLNLPVKDVKRTKAFFTSLGATFNDGPGDTDHSACMLVGTKQTVVMFFEEKMFEGFTGLPLVDANTSAQVLMSVGADTREEVDQIAAAATAAGANVFAPPMGIQGWMYSCAFADLDGHRWNVLFMEPR